MSINKVILVGRLGADPETRQTQSGAAVCNMRIATSESWTDKQTGQRQEQTEWHSVAAWGRLAETCQQYLTKGREVYVEGSIHTREYTDRDGAKRRATEIKARDVQFLGSASTHGQTPPPSSGGYRAGAAAGGGAGGQASARPAATTHDNDDDMPF